MGLALWVLSCNLLRRMLNEIESLTYPHLKIDIEHNVCFETSWNFPKSSPILRYGKFYCSGEVVEALSSWWFEVTCDRGVMKVGRGVGSWINKHLAIF